MLEGQIRGEVTTLTVAELEADPHGVFRRYRPIAPFIAHEAGGYVILRAKDVAQLLMDPRVQATETGYPKLHGVHEGTLFELFEHSMLTANGAVHRRRRSPFTRAFAARIIVELRPHIRATAEELIDSWHEEGEVDFVGRFAALIPARTISEMLGLPKQDIPHFTKLVYSVSRFLSFTFQPEDLPEIAASAQELEQYVRDLVAERRKAPGSDFLSTFLADADQKGELSPIEIIFQIVGVIIGGTDTSRVAMAVLVALLLDHREQWDAVCRDPALIPGAVVEAMRYEPSIASTFRYTLEDIDLDGWLLPGGSFLALSMMSAMRDEMVYERPDTFNIYRTDHPRLHPIFGGGAHRCIGEALSKAELEEGLAALVGRLPSLRLSSASPKVQGHSAIRRIDDMRVTWSK
jgi:cytochrome P450 family 103